VSISYNWAANFYSTGLLGSAIPEKKINSPNSTIETKRWTFQCIIRSSLSPWHS